MRAIRRPAVAGAAALLVALLPPSIVAQPDAAPHPDPYALIDRAIARWSARPIPARLAYSVDFRGTGAHPYERRFRVDEDTAAHTVSVVTTESDGPAPPFVDPAKQRLLPTETFGFISRDEAAVAPTPAPSDLPTIAAVHAHVRYPYNVSLTATERIDGVDCDVLALQPRHDPDAYQLRELAIDPLTADVHRIRARRFESLGPIRIPYVVTATYAADGPYWLIVHAEAGATIHAGLFSYGSSAQAQFADFAVRS